MCAFVYDLNNNNNNNNNNNLPFTALRACAFNLVQVWSLDGLSFECDDLIPVCALCALDLWPFVLISVQSNISIPGLLYDQFVCFLRFFVCHACRGNFWTKMFRGLAPVVRGFCPYHSYLSIRELKLKILGDSTSIWG